MIDVLRRRWALVLSVAVVIAIPGIWAYWSWYNAPQRVFQRMVTARVERSNSSGHLHALELMSPELTEWSVNRYEGGDPEMVLKRLSVMDSLQGRQYKLVSIDLFESGTYAEVTLARSGQGVNWAAGESFRLPFTYRAGKWLVLPAFRNGAEIGLPAGG